MKRIIVLIVVLLGVTAVFQPTFAQTGGGYDLTWSTIDGGGGQSNDAVYAVMGTVGQMDAGNATGSGYELSGGFWQTQLSSPTAITLHYLIAHPQTTSWFIPLWLFVMLSFLTLWRHKNKKLVRN